ncbi:MAG: UDP binding domain-containing protein, partial [Gammaproteobacteria bacterium]
PVIVFGLTFKEDVPDLRNSKVIDVIRELQTYGAEVYVHDPVADGDEAMHEYGVKLTAWEDLPKANAAIAAVAHTPLRERGLEALASKLADGAVLVDVKSAFDPAAVARTGLRLWRL